MKNVCIGVVLLVSIETLTFARTRDIIAAAGREGNKPPLRRYIAPGEKQGTLKEDMKNRLSSKENNKGAS
ncbi:MAG: hypothetical protein IJG83_03635 [Thermoguttaceae bacterium]|nr:hypothetical protein [Thermoguttaceae bacterium]MBQ3454173.1 hypothetical protein [Thermoguttaceae bacterium]